MTHSFEVGVAKRYGVNAAVLLNNIYFWCEKNRANDKNFHDGMYWTYNSRTAFTDLFPYLSERQIKTALDKLIEDGIIVTGDYNNDRWKRPTWYAVTKKGYTLLQNCANEGTEMSERTSENVISTITDINTDKNTDRKQHSLDGFDEFWKVYPRHLNRQDAIKAWRALKPSKEVLEAILKDIPKKMGDNGLWSKRDKDKIPYPATYLRGRQWEDEDDDSEQPKPSEPEWKNQGWWLWPKEEQERLAREVEERERNGMGLGHDSTH